MAHTAAAGDAVAQSILRQAGIDLANTAAATARNAGLVPPKADTLAGGLRLAQHPGEPPYQHLAKTAVRHG